MLAVVLAMDQPFNFVTTNDTIGGNSGSPVINRKGEIVGVIFDVNIGALGGDFFFDERVNRTVAVHSGAILEALHSVYKADRLAAEMESARGP
jgi:V8-like Glu-specific endopeptidase